MEIVTRNVCDIVPEDRRVLEHVMGRKLHDDQQIIIQVVSPHVWPATEAEAGRSADEVPDWWKIYDGLSDEEIDQLDQAIRPRANLSRDFE